ncbi:MAG: hypothetical protein BWY34_00477 [Parcubacteria group bacterium ADurb.Bin247]|jgi:hypothetical protein|nr:MAG: hypothetical protein BWY34_00477 [Parcubacteria group bacterium ADurb.Bin247]
MNESILLAKILGIILTIIPALYWFDKTEFLKNINLEKIKEHTFPLGLLSIVIGAIIVAIHNIWELNWTLVITIFAWASIIKGMVYITKPRIAIIFLSKMMNMKIYMILIFIIGLFLLRKGFIA